MSSATTKAVNFSFAALVFCTILTSILLIETTLRTFLYDELLPLETNRFAIGVIAAFLATVLIVTLLMRTQRLKRELEEKEFRWAKEDWEKTFNSLTDFVSVHDKDFTVTKVNNALCEFLNKKPEELVGKRCYQVFHNSEKPYANCPHIKTSELDHPVAEIINDPNIGVPLLVTCSPFFNDENVFQGSLHVARLSENVHVPKNKPSEMFPICASCKSIRDEKNNWMALEDYFIKKHEFQFTHTLCRDCQERMYPGFMIR